MPYFANDAAGGVASGLPYGGSVHGSSVPPAAIIAAANEAATVAARGGTAPRTATAAGASGSTLDATGLAERGIPREPTDPRPETSASPAETASGTTLATLAVAASTKQVTSLSAANGAGASQIPTGATLPMLQDVGLSPSVLIAIRSRMLFPSPFGQNPMVPQLSSLSTIALQAPEYAQWQAQWKQQQEQQLALVSQQQLQEATTLVHQQSSLMQSTGIGQELQPVLTQTAGAGQPDQPDQEHKPALNTEVGGEKPPISTKNT
jgi:hypothetical protein